MAGMMMRFAPDRLEGQFYLKDDLLQTKVVMLICFFFVSLLIYGDYLNFGLNAGFYFVVLARALFLLASAIMLAALQYVRTPAQHDWFIGVWVSFYIALSFYVNVTRPVANVNFTYIDTLVILVVFTVFPCSLWLKGLFAGMLTAGDLAILVFFKAPLVDTEFKTVGLAYILANVLGLFVASRLQWFRQKHYTAFAEEQNARRELETVAYVDHLTGALSRRKFFQLATLAMERCLGQATAFSLLMIDLDFFKRINDVHGHTAGDHYLQEFTKFIVENKRGGDIFGRLGGEEFALLLPDTDLKAAWEVAERLRRLCGEKCHYLDNLPLQTTISIGVAKATRKDRAFKDVLKRADDALYQAKRQGRDQVRLSIREEF